MRAVEASGNLAEEDAHDLGKVLSLQQLIEYVSVIMQLDPTVVGGVAATFWFFPVSAGHERNVRH